MGVKCCKGERLRTAICYQFHRNSHAVVVALWLFLVYSYVNCVVKFCDWEKIRAGISFVDGHAVIYTYRKWILSHGEPWEIFLPDFLDINQGTVTLAAFVPHAHNKNYEKRLSPYVDVSTTYLHFHQRNKLILDAWKHVIFCVVFVESFLRSLWSSKKGLEHSIP
jgi:hypothetical protein